MSRRGSALLLTLVLIVALGLLGAAALDLADRRVESARRDAALVRLRAAGRSALAAALARLDPDSALTLSMGESRRLDSTTLTQGMVALDSLTRLGPSLFQVSGTSWLPGRGGGIEARDATRELIQLVALQVTDTAAVIAVGPLLVEGSASVSGADWASSSAPACSASSAPGPAALIGPSGSVRIDSSSGANLAGSPPVLVDSAVGPGLMDRLATAPFLILAGAADHFPSISRLTPVPTARGPFCDTRDSLNWGDPTAGLADCGGYRPMIRLPRHSLLAGGMGQGVLVATGGLRIGGSFRYEGIILALGAVVVEDSAVISGVLVGGDSVTVRGEAVVTRSSCGVQEAEKAVGLVRPRPPRAWSRGP
ncbi:MAG: hypothetical protein OEV95_08370 [Gemmatimonadota bacterium]|nr:hypothetical protein [Gemmatimonadota bacterium]MDH5283580.1 hypothetical protein [Gemmatimonadota bacterium]